MRDSDDKKLSGLQCIGCAYAHWQRHAIKINVELPGSVYYLLWYSTVVNRTQR